VVARAALLDVNVLIALFDQNHVHHGMAHDWFADNRHRGWATCPITENGFVRIISNPTTGRNERPGPLVSYLRAFCAGEGHQFWAASLSLGDQTIFDLSFATHRLLTDVYLLGLAHVNGGTLATFDRTIPVKAVVGAPPDVLEVIGGKTGG
jgi:toxin-antitoxin system PIN domain toxin